MTDSIFMHQQVPNDYGNLANGLRCLPCNMDGVTERRGQFLVFEGKHGEELSDGQFRMLQEFASIPRFTVLVIDCKRTRTNEKGGRTFLPRVVRVMDVNGIQGDACVTNEEDFRARYIAWLKRPEDGALPFTLPAQEWNAKYSDVVTQRERDAVQYLADMLEKKVSYTPCTIYSP